MCSTNFSFKTVSIFFTCIIYLSGCSVKNNQAISTIADYPTPEKNLLVAVLPITNLSSTPAPLEEIRQLLSKSFRQKGLDFVGAETLERFIVRHRVRYTGGLNEMTARDLKYETGADAVLITSLELYSDAPPPPKIALTCRLVSTGNNPEILWIESVGLAGDDSVGLLQLSLIEDPRELLDKAVWHLSSSLAEYLSGEKRMLVSRRKIVKFWPKVLYRSPVLETDRKYTVAVVPFFNASDNRFAGEIMALHFVEELLKAENFEVIEPGIIRNLLLEMRIIMDGGLSVADARALFRRLNVNLILTGNVFDYQDFRGNFGKAKVDFSALIIERRSRDVVWACESYNEGDYGVFFFDWGKINTAHRIADEMVISALETLTE